VSPAGSPRSPLPQLLTAQVTTVPGPTGDAVVQVHTFSEAPNSPSWHPSSVKCSTVPTSMRRSATNANRSSASNRW
jgi:hypothetical protein